MSLRTVQLGVLLALCCSSLWGCDPEDACDKGFKADHGYCYPLDGGTGLVFPDGGDIEDGSTIMQDPNATFGKPCTEQSDCGGVAPLCGGTMFPFCTNINCMGMEICPSGWVCVDTTKYYQAPGVDSACIKF
ncbi:MAG TPA: hypothetical protein VJR89_19485 [Polyangiales bacterium]|nr:hypothetical protein [Polyangiales bacterium]